MLTNYVFGLIRWNLIIYGWHQLFRNSRLKHSLMVISVKPQEINGTKDQNWISMWQTDRL